MAVKQIVGLGLVVLGVFVAWSGAERFYDGPVLINYKGYDQPTSPAAPPLIAGTVMIVIGTMIARRWK